MPGQNTIGGVYPGTLTVARPLGQLVFDTATLAYYISTNSGAVAYRVADGGLYPDNGTATWGTGSDVIFTANGTDLVVSQGAGAGSMIFADAMPLAFGTAEDVIFTPDGTNVIISNTAAGAALWHDDVFNLADPADTTRRGRFDVGAVTAGQTRNFTLPDYDLSFLTGVVSQTLVADPGTAAAIPVTNSIQIDLTIGTGAETNTLAIPTAIGQRILIIADTVGMGGSRAITAAAAINQAGNTIMTFAQALDFIELVAVNTGGALRWRVAANDGVALS